MKSRHALCKTRKKTAYTNISFHVRLAQFMYVNGIFCVWCDIRVIGVNDTESKMPEGYFFFYQGSSFVEVFNEKLYQCSAYWHGNIGQNHQLFFFLKSLKYWLAC